ncbi:MAG: DEAD/DEAH box helicase [Candidatus Marsarchaeota archaeon]|nr:DEAD/DEAH box helicase [Candidatus Marsarchaeota archaeon]MCL5111928.1 DEAD/DEAH box helicase [Candidatus Marsarchaeota archaeon]
MDISSLKGRLPLEIIESLAKRGIARLTPPQEAAIKEGLLEYRNLVVASPTASGKTLIAEIACVKSILEKRQKAVYIAPMRALVTEKFNEFREAYPYMKAAMSIGDLDANDQWLADYEMIFVSTEKFDSLMRHGIEWVGGVGCIIFDEVHMLGDMSRGPTLEILITKLRLQSSAQIIALSATIGNANEIAKWLDAKAIESDYRPVKLSKGVICNNRVYYDNEESDEPRESASLNGTSRLPELRLVEDTIRQGKQALVFYSTRRNAEGGAKRIAESLSGILTKGNSAALDSLSRQVLGALDRPTEQCTKLSKLIKSGVAFHHAGLLNVQRNAIEEAFRANAIKVICATTTLAYGVNLPAHTVLLKDIHRYDNSSSGMMGVNEVMQIFGRAGRPKYDTEGRALIIAANMERMKELYRDYIIAKPEAIDSALGVVPVLRSHVLSLIATNFVSTKESMNSFFSKTFYGLQYNSMSHIHRVIDEVLHDLKRWEMVKEDDRSYVATKLGSRVSELYIDPLSAKWMVDSISNVSDSLDALFMISNTLEMRPYVRVTADAEGRYAAYLHTHKKLMLREFDPMDYGNYEPEGAFSTALMLNDWAEEMKEPEIVEKYSSTPGALYTKITNADWLIYSAIELSKILKMPHRKLLEMRVRLRYGIKEELLDLVRLQQIGRARARTLYMNGIRSVNDVRNNRAKVTSLLGKETADKVLSQV